MAEQIEVQTTEVVDVEVRAAPGGDVPMLRIDGWLMVAVEKDSDGKVMLRMGDAVLGLGPQWMAQASDDPKRMKVVSEAGQELMPETEKLEGISRYDAQDGRTWLAFSRRDLIALRKVLDCIGGCQEGPRGMANRTIAAMSEGLCVPLCDELLDEKRSAEGASMYLVNNWPEDLREEGDA